MVRLLPVLKITSSLPAPGTIVPCPTAVPSDELAAEFPTRMPPVLMVRVWPEAMLRLAAVAALLRKLAMVCVFQAVVLLAWKSTLAAVPGAVVPAVAAV